MDKRLVLAVAGSGKTTSIVDALCSEKRYLIITYTENNYENIHKRIIKRFGTIPSNIKLQTYFSFLYSFCVRPFLMDRLGLRGINWNAPPQHTWKLFRSDIRYYQDPNRRLYHNRMSRLLEKERVISAVSDRVTKYFDILLIDEIQDFAGNDFNFVTSLVKANLASLLVGDFHQHTYDTSRDGKINEGLFDDYNKYISRWEEAGCLVDTSSLAKSHRCSPSVCDFVSTKIGIPIESYRSDSTEVDYIDNEEKVRELMNEPSVVKLFFKESARYRCYSNNWGASKGHDMYQDVCVVLNPTTQKLFKGSNLRAMKPLSKNKLYVACTRARGNLYFIPDRLVKGYIA